MAEEDSERDSRCRSSTTLSVEAPNFAKSLKELRGLSSQMYHIADYCESAFCTSTNKSPIVEGTKEYVSRAVVAVVDHLGSISATLNLAISTNNAVPQAIRRIDALNQRIVKCQQHSEKLTLATFRWNSAEFSPKFHCRYIWSPHQQDSALMSSASSDPVSINDGEGTHTHAETKPFFDDLSSNSRDYRNLVLDDVLRALPETQQSNFQLHQMNRKPKRIGMKLKGLQNKEIAAAIIRRGKRILA